MKLKSSHELMKIVGKDAKSFAKNAGLLEKSLDFEKSISDAISNSLKGSSVKLPEGSNSPKSSKSQFRKAGVRNPSQVDHANSSAVYEEDKISMVKANPNEAYSDSSMVERSSLNSEMSLTNIRH